MSETNPIALVDELKAVLERYIATTLPISQRYPNLAERFRNELARRTSFPARMWKPCRISRRARR